MTREATSDSTSDNVVSGQPRPHRGPLPAASDGRARLFSAEAEVAACTGMRPHPPVAFPVVHRSGAATLRTTIVARRPASVLVCDGAHGDDHMWPSSELNDADTRPTS